MHRAGLICAVSSGLVMVTASTWQRATQSPQPEQAPAVTTAW
jgi:hypothetical protein